MESTCGGPMRHLGARGQVKCEVKSKPPGVSAWWKETAQTRIRFFSFLVAESPWTTIKQSQTLTTHNANRHCRVRFYTFVGQPLSKQLYSNFTCIAKNNLQNFNSWLASKKKLIQQPCGMTFQLNLNFHFTSALINKRQNVEEHDTNQNWWFLKSCEHKTCTRSAWGSIRELKGLFINYT